MFPFEPNPNWSHFYVPGHEIQEYVLQATRKWNLDKDIQFNTRAIETVWDDDLGKWKVVLDQAGTIIHDEADILVNASGVLK
jgi:cation diffusion facilitator CzcD-associated flavoprotein CzcO